MRASGVSFLQVNTADWISQNGLIAETSENGETDPLPGFPQGIAVLWQNGTIINLGALDGGCESVANAVNEWGQVTVLGNFRLAIAPDPRALFRHTEPADSGLCGTDVTWV